jgi:hypothetical protein
LIRLGIAPELFPGAFSFETETTSAVAEASHLHIREPTGRRLPGAPRTVELRSTEEKMQGLRCFVLWGIVVAALWEEEKSPTPDRFLCRLVQERLIGRRLTWPKTIQ